MSQSPTFTTAEAEALLALQKEYLEACAAHPDRALGDAHVEPLVAPDFIKRWEPIAQAESPTHRPHQIMLGMILIRVKRHLDRIDRN